MLNICLCDDEIDVLDCYSHKINEISYKHNYAFKIETFRNGESLIFDIEEDPNRFNIIIIDIIMKSINGIDTAKILRNRGYSGIIIFLTSSKEFALDSFEVEPLNYILKDDSNNRFEDIFLKAAAQVDKNCNKNIIISSKNQNKVVNLDRILYMESLNKKAILHNIYGEREEVNIVFKNIYEKIKEHGFIRCHKSYIINIEYVKSFNNLECRLQGGVTVPIGRKYLKDFKNMIVEKEFGNILL
ncbi:LytR/AlgR family response regulator transcription factor [Terrisporobacter glycolicus]|uniref:Stage 0 sporulation protein A homolog n=1 Tax=Terrisporobacter glycolicus ATCC 14880 = DSM 1288 TaxID=1121315 RepID=A0ABZ2EU14_9FIRM|nr:response regulator transcription factor [Terrisporobacter glycolicus]